MNELPDEGRGSLGGSGESLGTIPANQSIFRQAAVPHVNLPKRQLVYLGFTDLDSVKEFSFEVHRSVSIGGGMPGRPYADLLQQGEELQITDGWMSCLSWKWRKRSSVKIAERTYEEGTEAFHSRKKIAILGRHLVDKVPVSELCEALSLRPTVFYRWQKELFENGAAAFQSQERPQRQVEGKQKRIEFSEKKVQTKDEVLAELMAEHVALKKVSRRTRPEVSRSQAATSESSQTSCVSVVVKCPLVPLSAMNGIFATGFSGAVRGRRALPDFTLERLLYRAGQVVPAHYHAEPAIILLVSGHCTLRNDFRCDLPCAPGAAIVHPAGEQHSYRYEADRDSQMLAITLPIRSCERFRSPLDLERPRLAHDPEIAPLMARLRHRVQQPHTSALSLEATVFELLGQLCGSRKESSLTPSLARVRDLLHSRFKEPLSLTEIARSTDLSPIQLARHFRRQFGCSPAAYIRKLRLAYACERLASSSLPIVDLAHELGFFDQSHFCHTFGKHFGVSPVAYRSNTGRH